MAVVILFVSAVAACGSSHQAATPTSSSPVSTTQRAAPTTVERLSQGVHLFGACPKRFPHTSLLTLNAAVSGLDNRLVPFVASSLEICRYEVVRVSRSATATRLVGALVVSGSTAKRLEKLGNEQPLARGNCPGAAANTFFLLTFANHSQQVQIEQEAGGTDCNIGPTNGKWGGGASTAQWRGELLRNT